MEQYINNIDSLNTNQRLGMAAVNLLKELTGIPAISGAEKQRADDLEIYLQERYAIRAIRKYNNLWCYNRHFDLKKPTVLLTTHLDTPKRPEKVMDGSLSIETQKNAVYGLGVNDAGASLVSMISAFIYFYEWKALPYNLCLALTAEEQISGKQGLRAVLSDLMPVTFAVVGTATNMQLAIAEMGAMVLDCTSIGYRSVTSTENCCNAIYRALRDISWFSTYEFPLRSEDHKSVRMYVTEINAGIRHNIVPDTCFFTVDIRHDNCYSEKEILNTISNHTFCEVEVRKKLLAPLALQDSHPFIKAGIALGMETFFSQSSSERGLLHIPSLTLGPGDPLRSGLPGEYVLESEILLGVELYIKLLESFATLLTQRE